MHKALDYKAILVLIVLGITGVPLDALADSSTAIESGQTVTGTIDSNVNASYVLTVGDPSFSLVYLVLDQTPVDYETSAYLLVMDGSSSTWQYGINTEGDRYTLTYKPQNATQTICITCNSWYSASCTFNLTATVYSMDDSPSLNNSFTVAGYVPTSSPYIYFSVNVTGHFTIEFGGSYVTAYVAAAHVPSAFYYDKASVSYGDKVNITFTGDDPNGMYYIALSQAAAYKQFPFSIRAISVSNTGIPLIDGVQINGTTPADYEFTYYYFDAPETGFAIQASGYVYIYVGLGFLPDFATFSQEFYSSGTTQNFLVGGCSYANSLGGRWFIGIYGTSQTYTLTATSSYSSVPTSLSLGTPLSDSVSGGATWYTFSVSSTSDLISIDMDLTVSEPAYYADYMSMKVAVPGSCASASNYGYAGATTGDGRITLVFLPQETGNYSIYVDSQYPLTLTYTITVSSDVNGKDGLHLQSSTPWAGYVPYNAMMYFTVHTYTTGFILSVSGYWLSIYVQESSLPSSYNYLQYAYSDSTSTNVTLCNAEPGDYYIALYQIVNLADQPFSINVFNTVGSSASVTQLNPWVDLQGTASSNPVYYTYTAGKGDTLIVNITSAYSDYLYLYGGDYTSASYECDSSPSIPSTYQGSTNQETTTLIYKVNDTATQLFAVLSTMELVSFSINLQIVNSYFGSISLDDQTSVSAYTDITGLLFTLDVSSATTISFTTSGTIIVYASNTIGNPSASSYSYTATSNGDISIDPCSTNTDSGAWYFTVISEYGLTSVQISIVRESECETNPIDGPASTETVSNVGVIVVSAIAVLCVLIGLIICAVAINRRCSAVKKYHHVPVIPGTVAPVIAVKVNETLKTVPPQQGSHIQQPRFPQYPYPPQTPYPQAPSGPYLPFYNQTMAYYMPTQQNVYPPMFMPQAAYLQMQVPPQHTEETH